MTIQVYAISHPSTFLPHHTLSYYFPKSLSMRRTSAALRFACAVIGVDCVEEETVFIDPENEVAGDEGKGTDVGGGHVAGTSIVKC